VARRADRKRLTAIFSREIREVQRLFALQAVCQSTVLQRCVGIQKKISSDCFYVIEQYLPRSACHRFFATGLQGVGNPAPRRNRFRPLPSWTLLGEDDWDYCIGARRIEFCSGMPSNRGGGTCFPQTPVAIR
jgi:hypothetical protein